MRPIPKVLTIPNGAPFLPILAEAVTSGRLGPVGGDPLGLAAVTIYLPTRRAARALSAAFLEAAGGRATVLPSVRPIGDVDEEEHLLLPAAELPADRLALPPAVAPLERLLALTRLVIAWGRSVRRHMLADEAQLIPASAADATRLAADLARLMDEMATAGIGWEALAKLAPDGFAAHWQVTLQFLEIATRQWPEHLRERGRADPAERRDRLIRAEAARLAAHPPAGLVVAAGSTGSIPATAELLRTIARLPNGAVVLPGLDLSLDAPAWEAIGGPEAKEPAPSHPQYGMKQLLAAIGTTRDGVELLGAPAAPARAALLSEAMRPAATTDRWAGAATAPEALDGIATIAARNEAEEALAIALVLREAVEDKVAAALVTPERALARRVAVELGRWGLAIDDSAGLPLAGTPPAVLARLVADAALGGGEPLALLALAKHPLAAFGMERAACRQAARALEIAALRGMRPAGGIGALADAVWAARKGLTGPEGRFAHARQRLAADDWRAASELAKALARALAPLEALAAGEASVAALTRCLIAALRIAGGEAGGGDGALWQGPAGEGLAALLAGLLDAEAEALVIGAAEYPAFLAAAMAGVTVGRPPTGDPRIHLWGTLEARLQTVGLMVLGGLDEGVWPAETRTDAWLSRAMRAGAGLPAPERRIGLAAHDFVQAMGAPRVVVTRADKRGGSPTVASRWLQRLEAVAGAAGSAAMAARGRPYLDWARSLDRVRPEAVHPTRRPEPRPPLSARPRSLSITEIETWIRDPYAIYARRVLKLEPLDPIGKAPDAALRGNLVHEVLARFAKEWRGPFDAAAEERLLAIGEELFQPLREFPEVHALWWLRCRAIARWMVAWEAGRAAAVAERHAEIAGALEFGPPDRIFRLRGRADRIDVRHDGGLEIIDFKTGQPPSPKQVLTFAPQLALEVAIARAGGFGEAFEGRSTAELAWIGLGRVGRGDPWQSAVDKADPLPPDEMGRRALKLLKELVHEYDKLKQPYASEARPMFAQRFEGPYEHLARVREWRLGEGAEDE